MEDPKETQIDVFKSNIFVKRHNLPFVVHTRDALEDTYAVCKVGVGLIGIMPHTQDPRNGSRIC